MKILLISTDTVFGELLAQKLNLVGYSVCVVNNKDKFYSKISDTGWDVFVIAVTSLNENIFRVVEYINRHSISSEPKIYVISWVYDGNTKVALSEAGVIEYMTLPIDIRRFISKISRQSIVNNTQ